MGFFSGITNALFGDPGEDIRRASNQQIGFQREALDYLKGIQELPLQYRDQAMRQLMGFYTGDPEVQQQMVERAQSSPFYQSMVQAGQEGVLDKAQAMGMSRSGNVARDLSRSNQAVLQGLLQQNLQGLQGFAGTPVSGQGVANVLQSMGQTAGSAGMGIAQAQQSGMGQLLGLGASLFGAFSDRRLKDNIIPLYRTSGHNIYSWTWNKKANKLGLYGAGMGVMADEVKQVKPEAVGNQKGYDTVDYQALGIF